MRWSRLKEDAAIGIVLSVFFGAGIVLLTHIQRLPGGNQSGLDKFLFGQAATLVRRDVVVMAVVAVLVATVIVALYKELAVVTFDRDFAESLGLPVRRLEIVLTLLLVLVVVVGLQTVGVVLIVATLVTPAAAARQWTDSLGIMLVLAALVGGGAGAVGAVVSASGAGLPTGPVIVLVASAVLVVSLLFAPRRGLLWSWLEERRAAGRIRRENLLKDLYRLGEPPLPTEHATDAADAADAWRDFTSLPHLMGVRGSTAAGVQTTARRLASRGLVERSGDDLRLTDSGFAEAASVVRKHRLWELYLTRRLELAEDHVHRDAEAMEHALTDADVARLDEVLGHPRTDPHGRPIPRPETRVPRPLEQGDAA